MVEDNVLDFGEGSALDLGLDEGLRIFLIVLTSLIIIIALTGILTVDDKNDRPSKICVINRWFHLLSSQVEEKHNFHRKISM